MKTLCLSFVILTVIFGPAASLAHNNESVIETPVNRDESVNFPFDPQTADGNTINDYIAAQTNHENAVLVNGILRNKTVGRTLTFTNMVVIYVQRLGDGGINLMIGPRQDGRARRHHSDRSFIQVMFDAEGAKKASFLDRDDIVARVDGLAVTNSPKFPGFVVKGVSLTPQDLSITQPLPPFDATKITGDELIDYLHGQRRTIRKWQFIDIQNRLAGRRLTFHKLRLSGSGGVLHDKSDQFWIGAIAGWEKIDGGDRTGRAEFKLSFPDRETQELAIHLFMRSNFPFLGEVTGTFAKDVNPDDGWAFQLEDVSLLPPTGIVKGLADLGGGVVSGDELVRRIGANFTPIEQLSISFLLKEREMYFTSAVVESCRPCWTNDTLSLTCRFSPPIESNRRGQNPFRISFEIPAEKAKALRRTPIPGDLVTKIKGRPAALGTPDPRRRNYTTNPVLALDHADFDITWLSDVVNTDGIDLHNGDHILRRLCLCWPEVRDDQLIRLARKISGQKIEFSLGFVEQSSRQPDGSLLVKMTTPGDPLYGESIRLPLLVTDAALAQKSEELKTGTILSHISGTVTVELYEMNNGKTPTLWPRLKDATFELAEKPTNQSGKKRVLN